MATRKVGAVAVEAIAETAGFEKDLETSLKKAVNEAAKDANWDPLVNAAGDAGFDAGAAFSFRFKSRASHEFGKGDSFFTDSKLAQFFTSAGSNAAGFFSKAFSFGSDLFGELGKAGGLLPPLAKLFSALGGIGGGGLASIGGLLISLGVLSVVVPLLTAAFFALGGAIAGLIGTTAALPALFSGILVTILPLVIAFQGFGEAISALTSGDMEKFNEALKNLSPSAAAFAREIQRLMPFFTGLRKIVQEAFFAEIVGSLEKFVTRAGPAITGGLGMIATALGNLAAGILELFSRRETVDFMARLFESVANGLTAATPVLVRFFGALLTLADKALPVVETFFAQVGSALDEFSKFITDAAASGELEQFLLDSFAILGQIGGILRELISLFGAMFGDEASRAGAKAFLSDIERLLAAITAWFQSPEGQRFLENMAILAEDFFDVLNLLVLPALGTMLGLLVDILNTWRAIGDFIDGTSSGRGGGRGMRLGMAATGGITQGPVIAGEAGTEAILPLDDPVRARQIASDPLVQNVLGGMGDITVYAVFDGEPFQARIARVAQGVVQGASRQLTQKPRTVIN